MTRLTDRLLDSASFKRRKATADTKRKITAWEIWECDDPTFSHDYVRTVSLLVHSSAAIVRFDTGETVDLMAGDFLTIEAGARAQWTISEPLRNSYQYHDTFMSASNREDQVRWQRK